MPPAPRRNPQSAPPGLPPRPAFLTLALAAAALPAAAQTTAVPAAPRPARAGAFAADFAVVSLLLLVAVLVAWILTLGRRIRDLRDKEAALRETEERLRRLSDNLPNGMIYQVTRGPDGLMRFLHVSASVKRIHGLNPLEVLEDAEVFFRQIIPEDRNRLFESEARSLAAMQTMKDEVRIRNRAGELRWVRIASTPRQLTDGRIVWDGFEIDVTDEKKAAETLQESESRWRAIFDAAGIGIAVVDRHGRPLQTNPALQNILGYSAEELTRLTIANFTHRDDIACDLERLRELFAGTRPHYRIEKRYLRKDGSLLWGHLTVSAIQDGDARPSFAMGMVEDITERKRAEAALRESEERLREVFEHTNEIIFFVRVKHPERFLYTYVNRAGADYGFDCTAFASGTKTPHDIFPAPAAATVIDNYRRCVAARRPILLEQSFHLLNPASPGGARSRYFATALVPLIDRDGSGVVRIVAFSREVTAPLLAVEALN